MGWCEGRMQGAIDFERRTESEGRTQYWWYFRIKKKHLLPLKKFPALEDAAKCRPKWCLIWGVTSDDPVCPSFCRFGRSVCLSFTKRAGSFISMLLCMHVYLLFLSWNFSVSQSEIPVPIPKSQDQIGNWDFNLELGFLSGIWESGLVFVTWKEKEFQVWSYVSYTL